MNFLLELDRNSHEDEIKHLIQRMLHESMPRKWRSICLPNIYKKKQSQICKSKPKYSFLGRTLYIKNQSSPKIRTRNSKRYQL